MIILALAGGLLGVIASLALRRDTQRVRNLEKANGFVDERFIYLSLPGFSLLLLGFGALGLVMPLTTSWPMKLVAFACGLVALLGAGMSAWGLFASRIPSWLLPKWRK